MLARDLFRNDPDRVRRMLEARHTEAPLDRLLEVDAAWRGVLVEVEELPLRPWGPGVKRRYVKIVPEHVSGRRIAVPGRADTLAEH